MADVVRRPQPSREWRDKTTEIRWTAAERRQLGAAARRRGLSISSLIRSTVLPAVQADVHDQQSTPDTETFE